MSADDHRGVRRLDTGEVGRGVPPGQAARGRRRDRWHGRQLSRGHVGVLAVQSDQRVATQQLRLRQPDQQLTSGGAAGTLLDGPKCHGRTWPPRRSSRRTPRAPRPLTCGQRRVRRADADTHRGTLSGRLATTYSLHRQGALSAWILDGLNNRDSPSRQAPVHITRRSRRHYSRIRL